MTPNPVLKKLGFTNDDRVVIIHADDIGMCQASIEAFSELVDCGIVSSGAVMVPCAWFPAVAQFSQNHLEADIGIHLTLTSEYDQYRWGPISTRDPASGLMDSEGYFHKRSEAVWEFADPDYAARELEAQISRAAAAGMHLTHIDTHMGSVAHAQYIPAYVQLALKYQLPPMIPRMSAAALSESDSMGPGTAQMIPEMIAMLEEMGVPLLDHLSGLALDDSSDRLETARRALKNLQPGITHFIIHPCKDTPEIRHITSSWDCRVADYETFTSKSMQKFIEQEGIQVIGYQALKALMPDV